MTAPHGGPETRTHTENCTLPTDHKGHCYGPTQFVGKEWTPHIVYRREVMCQRRGCDYTTMAQFEKGEAGWAICTSCFFNWAVANDLPAPTPTEGEVEVEEKCQKCGDKIIGHSGSNLDGSEQDWYGCGRCGWENTTPAPAVAGDAESEDDDTRTADAILILEELSNEAFGNRAMWERIHPDAFVDEVVKRLRPTPEAEESDIAALRRIAETLHARQHMSPLIGVLGNVHSASYLLERISDRLDEIAATPTENGESE